MTRDEQAKAILADFLRDGHVAVMFVWGQDERCRYFGQPMRPDQLETLLKEAARNFAPEVSGTIQ